MIVNQENMGEHTWDDEEQLEVSPDRNVTRKLFRARRSPRYGERNPERMNNPVWEWLVRSRSTAYAAAQRFKEPSALEVGLAGASTGMADRGQSCRMGEQSSSEASMKTRTTRISLSTTTS
jgi:hypothetical protein